MWWYLVKEKDEDNKVIYNYGRETKVLSGKIMYDRETGIFQCLKLADNDSNFEYAYLLPHVHRIIINENAPYEKQIAIG